MQGTAKWFTNSKGYGFIGREDGPDVFVHYSAIVGDGYRTLEEGDPVEFEIVQGPKGPQAASVRKSWLAILAMLLPASDSPSRPFSSLLCALGLLLSVTSSTYAG